MLYLFILFLLLFSINIFLLYKILAKLSMLYVCISSKSSVLPPYKSSKEHPSLYTQHIIDEKELYGEIKRREKGNVFDEMSKKVLFFNEGDIFKNETQEEC